jgi:hypothetical protein
MNRDQYWEAMRIKASPLDGPPLTDAEMCALFGLQSRDEAWQPNPIIFDEMKAREQYPRLLELKRAVGDLLSKSPYEGNSPSRCNFCFAEPNHPHRVDCEWELVRQAWEKCNE